MTEKKNANLPSIQTLFQDAWELFQKTFLSYLKLIGLGISFLFLGSLIGILISLPVTVITFGSHFQVFRHLTPFYATILVLLGLWALFYIVSILAIGIIFPIVSIFLFQEKKATLFELIKESKHFFWPYFLATLLSGLLVLGGMSLFIIPGIVIAILFSFVAYEVVLDKQSGIAALQRSYAMVKSYFWQVIGRIVLLELCMIIISSVLQKMAIGSPLVGFVRFLFSFAFMWYLRAYAFVLYQQIRERTTFSQHISIQWIWIVSVVGWVVFLLLIGGLIVVGVHLPGMLHQTQLPRIPKGAV